MVFGISALHLPFWQVSGDPDVKLYVSPSQSYLLSEMTKKSKLFGCHYKMVIPNSLKVHELRESAIFLGFVQLPRRNGDAIQPPN